MGFRFPITNLSLNTESTSETPALSPMYDSPKRYMFESDTGSSISLEHATSSISPSHVFQVTTPSSNQPAIPQSASSTEIDFSAETNLFGTVPAPFYTLPLLSNNGEVIGTEKENDDTNSHNSLYSASTISLEPELKEEPAPEKKKHHKRKSVSPAESDLSESRDSSESHSSSQSKKDLNKKSAREYRARKKEMIQLKEKVKSLEAKVSQLNGIVKKLKIELATAHAGTSGYTNYQSGSVNQDSGLRFLGTSYDSSTDSSIQASHQSNPRNGI